MINYNVPKPKLSPDFTIDDIHKIREWHYEQLKNATIEEQIAFYNEPAKKILLEIENCKNEYNGQK